MTALAILMISLFVVWVWLLIEIIRKAKREKKQEAASGEIEITEVTIGLGSSFNDPWENYSNYKPSITIKAQINQTDEPAKKIKLLQREVYELLVMEKKRILELCNLRAEKEGKLEIFE